jgi:hypothetical protein
MILSLDEPSSIAEVQPLERDEFRLKRTLRSRDIAGTRLV